jgi:ATP-dependent Clp protease ATP-binding subunit ClpA
MFERFTHPAREVVGGAQAQARLLAHTYIGTEHLLLGLLAEGTSVAGRVLAGRGVDLETVRSEIVRIVGPVSPAQPDAEALEVLGIDLDAVRRKVEETFGPGALDRTRAARRRGCGPRGHIPFTPRSKKVLELSLREALRLRHNYIGTEHILLAILREGQGLAAQMLARAGVDHATVEQRILEELGTLPDTG